MPISLSRRSLLMAALAAPLSSVWAATKPQSGTKPQLDTKRLSELEAAAGGRLGVVALDVASSRRVQHRATERFPMCSTFKVLASSAILQRSGSEPTLLDTHIEYTTSDLVAHSPITEKHVDKGMTVAELCAATLQYSDNAAANLLMKQLGGPQAVTAYARSIGDDTFRLDRWETELNTAIPGDPRDTTSPQAMADTLQRLVLGDALPAPQRQQLKTWMLGNTTGSARIRAGVPAEWQVGDKTGAGAYGTVNDIGVLWPSADAAIRGPVVLAVYFTQREPEAPMRNDVVASAARIAVDLLSRA